MDPASHSLFARLAGPSSRAADARASRRCLVKTVRKQLVYGTSRCCVPTARPRRFRSAADAASDDRASQISQRSRSRRPPSRERTHVRLAMSPSLRARAAAPAPSHSLLQSGQSAAHTPHTPASASPQHACPSPRHLHCSLAVYYFSPAASRLMTCGVSLASGHQPLCRPLSPQAAALVSYARSHSSRAHRTRTLRTFAHPTLFWSINHVSTPRTVQCPRLQTNNSQHR